MGLDVRILNELARGREVYGKGLDASFHGFGELFRFPVVGSRGRVVCHPQPVLGKEYEHGCIAFHGRVIHGLPELGQPFLPVGLKDG